MRSLLVCLSLLLAVPAWAQSGAAPGGPAATTVAPAASSTTRARTPARATPAAPATPAAAATRENCTRESPCTGTRGGRYYYTRTGAKRYLRR